MIQKVMERIVDQSIPEAVIDNPRVDWNPFTNDVTPTAAVDFDEAAVPPSAGSATPGSRTPATSSSWTSSERRRRSTRSPRPLPP